MYLEMEVPLSAFRWEGKTHMLKAFKDTWTMLDEDKYVDPQTTPMFHMYCCSKRASESKYDPFNRTVSKMGLYVKIKEEGFDHTKHQRMTCSFMDPGFNIRNGHHRLSMVQHWGKPDPLTILVKTPEKRRKN